MAGVSVFRAHSSEEPAFELGTLRNPLALNVDVLSGVHAGVSQRVDGGAITIGASPDCDLILFADDVGARHVTVAPRSNWSSAVAIKAVDGPVILDSGERLEPGQWAEGQMPLDLSLNGTHVTITRSVNPHEFARPALAVAMALGLIVVGPNLVDTAFSSVKRSIEIQAPVAAPDPVTTATPAVQFETAQVIDAFRDRVRESDLGHLIEISAGRDGTILASGEIGRENGRDWRRVLQWYDAVPNGPDLVNAVRVGKSPEMPSIASVWLLGEPEITLASGEKLREGDRARGGWVVKSIAEEGVILTRNGSDVTLTF